LSAMQRLMVWGRGWPVRMGRRRGAKTRQV
jgi:hypothetical protein